MSEHQQILGIGGISRSGKSILSAELKRELESLGITTKVLEMDQFVIEESRIPTIRDRTDWEHPASIDWKKLSQAIQQEQAKVIIIEGIFIFSQASKSLNITCKILLDIDRETFLQRRKKEKRWGEEPDWYLEHVWQSNQKLIEKARPDLEIKNPVTDAMDYIMVELLKRVQ